MSTHRSLRWTTLLCAFALLVTTTRANAAQPFETTGLRLWLDGADTSTIIHTTSPGFVEQWNDKAVGAANNAVQGTLANKPKTGSASLNGRNLVTFNGGQLLVNAAGTLAPLDTSRTVIFVSTSFRTGEGDIAIGLSGTNGGANTAWGITNTTVYGKTGPADVTGLASFGNQGLNVPQIMGVTYDNSLVSAHIKRYANGATVTAGANRAAAPYATTAGYIVGDWSDFNRKFGAGGTDGNVAEILVYDRVLNTAERIVTENYLAAKWDRTVTNNRYQYDAGGINYDTDVFGVGRFDASNTFENTESAGLRINATGGGLDADNEWALAGHNVVNNSVLTTGLPTNLTQRWDRVWAIDQTSNDGVSASLTFDFSEAGLTPPAPGESWVLVYSSTLPSGASHPFQLLAYPASIVGDEYTYTLSTSQLLDGYFTLATIVVPEPSTLTLAVLGVAGLGYRRRRQGKA